MTSWCCSCTTPAVASTRPSRSPRTRRWCGPAERRSRPFGSWPYHFVTIDPSSSVAQARKELGARLRQLRKSAGLTGQALADATGQHVTRVSRVEHGIPPPTERNIRDWCVACGAEDQIPDLIATAQNVESAYLEWTRQTRAGMRRLGGPHSIATYRRTTHFRIHEPIVLPGIFQTETYIQRMLAFWYKFLDAPDDTDATIAMRAERTAVALHAIATIGVWIFDNHAAALETPTAAIKVTRHREIALPAKLFDQHQV